MNLIEWIGVIVFVLLVTGLLGMLVHDLFKAKE